MGGPINRMHICGLRPTTACTSHAFSKKSRTKRLLWGLYVLGRDVIPVFVLVINGEMRVGVLLAGVFGFAMATRVSNLQPSDGDQSEPTP